MSLSIPAPPLGARLQAAQAPAARNYFDSFQINSEVEAGESTSVDITFDSYDAEYFDEYVGLRIYVATTPPGWGTGPACYLLNNTDLDPSGTQFDVTIPASVVPDDGSYLELSYSFIDDEGYSSNTYTYSNDFQLDGANGRDWSALELNGWAISNPDYVPCSAMECSRDCSDKYYPDGDLDYDEDSASFDTDTYTEWYDCLSACPGTTYPTIDLSDDGDDNSSSSIETATASASSTSKTATSMSATASASSTSKSTASSTGSATATGAIATTTATTISGASRSGLTVTGLLVSCVGVMAVML